MKIGFVGLGKMGQQIVDKLLQAGHETYVYDVNTEAVESAVQRGAQRANSREDLVSQLGVDPVVWLMIPADFVDAEIEAYTHLLPRGATLIDGGNSDFRLSRERAKACEANGIAFLDVGTSGGILGAEQGFCMMVGGHKPTYDKLVPVFDALASPKARYAYMGPSGAGHYVKMIHNGVEYALMQSYAEGYDLLKYGEYEGLDLATIAHVWQGGSIIQSSLNDLVGDILDEDPEMANVDGYVADSGEGRWTYEVAEKADVPMPALREALAVRVASQNGYHTFATKLLASMRNKFGGHAINKTNK